MSVRKVWWGGAWVDISGGGGAAGGVPFGQMYSQTASAWGTANRAVLVPVRVTADTLIDTLGTRIFTSNGNLDIGIYTDTSDAPDDLLISTGSVASPGTGFRTFSVAETNIPAGRVWLAIASSSTTFAVYSIAHSSASAGFADPGSSSEIDARLKATSMPLPDPISGTSATSDFMPVVWASHT